MKKVILICLQSMYVDNNTGITIRSFLNCDNFDYVGEFYFYDFYKKNISTDGKLSECLNIDPNFSFLRAIIKIIYLANSKRIKRIINTIKPDFLYLVAGDYRVNLLCSLLSKKFRIPIIIHHFDNIRQSFNKSNSIIAYLYRKNLDRIEKKSILRLVIGEDMKKNYALKYHKKYEVLMNSVDIKAYKPIKTIPTCKTIVYTGGLHLERVKSLLKVEEAISKFANKNFKLLIYSNDTKYMHLFNERITIFKQFVEHSKIEEVYDNAFILLHVESFNSDNTFYKYSISTKISEYLISSKLTLCFSPDDIAISNLIKNNELGVFCGSYDDLYSFFEYVDDSESFLNYYNRISKNAHRFASTYFSKKFAHILFNKYLI